MAKKIKEPRGHLTNEGIQASRVDADVLAVGRNARAVKFSVSTEKAIKEIDALFDSTKQLPDAIRTKAQEKIGELRETVSNPKGGKSVATSKLKELAGILHDGGEVVKESSSLVDNLGKVANALGLSLKLLGISF